MYVFEHPADVVLAIGIASIILVIIILIFEKK